MRDVIGRFDSTTLAGQPLTVPDNLDGPALLLFAYRQSQQRDIDTWLRLVPPGSDVSVLEVPVLGRRWLPGRRLIDGGMASNMDQATREQTMCVYTNVSAFRRDVLGTTSSQVLAVLVDAAGHVLWHAQGPAGDTGAAAFRQALRHHVDNPSPRGPLAPPDEEQR